MKLFSKRECVLKLFHLILVCSIFIGSEQSVSAAAMRPSSLKSVILKISRSSPSEAFKSLVELSRYDTSTGFAASELIRSLALLGHHARYHELATIDLIPSEHLSALQEVRLVDEAGTLSDTISPPALLIASSAVNIKAGLGAGLRDLVGRISVEVHPKELSLSDASGWIVSQNLSQSSGKNRQMIPVDVDGFDKHEQFAVVRNEVVRALEIADEQKLESIAVTLLGYGGSGELTARQSAEAIMAGIAIHEKQGGSEKEVRISVPFDQYTTAMAAEVLRNKSYLLYLEEAPIGNARFDHK